MCQLLGLNCKNPTDATFSFTGFAQRAGVTDHHVEDADMIGHIVKLVEAKAAEIDAGTSVSMDTLHGKAA